MINTRTYICETCTHESVCKYANEMKDLKDVASVKVTCRNRTLQYYTAKTDTARVATANRVMAENYGD